MDAVFDIETESWTRFVLGGVYEANGRYRAFNWEQEDKLVDALLSIKGHVWAHNGGGFDFKWLLDHVAARGIPAKVFSAGSGIIYMKIRETTFCDSKALTKISLRKLTAGMQVQKDDLGLSCIGRKNGCTEFEGDCEGYCAIRRDMPLAQRERLGVYLERDCESLFKALQALQEFADAEDLDLSKTVGASAWAHARRTLSLPKASFNIALHDEIRKGYFGGRTQVFNRRAPVAHVYDVNSMYPSRLSVCPMPVGDPDLLAGRAVYASFDRGALGVWTCLVSVPEMFIPPLPVRTKEGIAYPTGRFRGTWTTPELANAIVAGVKVIGIEKGVVFPGRQIIFADWVEKVFSLRDKAGKSGPIGTFLKFFLNSLTGKFASNRWKETFYLNPEHEPWELECECGNASEFVEGTDYGDTEPCLGHCGRLVPYQDSSFIFTRLEERLDDCAHIHWAAFLTAEARVELFRMLVSRNGGLDALYCDTDSCFSMEERTRRVVSDNSLGFWKKEKTLHAFEVFAPKCYTGLEPDGTHYIRAKGARLPRKNLALAHALVQSGVVPGVPRVSGFRAGLRGLASGGALFRTEVLSRKFSRGLGDRFPHGENSTRPPRFSELKLKSNS